MTKAQIEADVVAWTIPAPPGRPSGSRYLDEHGYGRLFVYEDILPPAPQKSPDDELLILLGRYRASHLKPSNPLIVRFKLHTQHGTITLHVGLFVSGAPSEDDYILKRKDKAQYAPVLDDKYLCSEVFKIDYSFKDIVSNDSTYSNASNELKGMLNREKLIQESGKIVTSMLEEDPYIKELERKIKTAIQQKEADISQKLRIYRSKFGMYSVPSFIPMVDDLTEGVFPITLASMYKNIKGLHFASVAKRIFHWNIKNEGKRKEKSTMSTEFQRLQGHLLSDPTANEFCHRMFGRNPVDGDGKDGCFDTAFDYYFSDSEQVFIEWLDAIETRIDLGIAKGIDEFPFGVFELPGQDDKPFSSLLQLEDVIVVSKIQLEFLSYFDMCPACRGTLSYLMGIEKDDNKSWIQRRTEKFIQTWFAINQKYVNILDTAIVEASCLSIAECNKGEHS
jgi:hypothetical protein